MSQQRFLCRNTQLSKQQELEKKSQSRHKLLRTQRNHVATEKTLSRRTPEAEGHEKLVANRFGVATQYIYVVTRTRLLHQNSVMTLSKSIATRFKKELREQVATEELHDTTEAHNKD